MIPQRISPRFQTGSHRKAVGAFKGTKVHTTKLRGGLILRIHTNYANGSL